MIFNLHCHKLRLAVCLNFAFTKRQKYKKLTKWHMVFGNQSEIFKNAEFFPRFFKILRNFFRDFYLSRMIIQNFNK